MQGLFHWEVKEELVEADKKAEVQTHRHGERPTGSEVFRGKNTERTLFLFLFLTKAF